MGAGLCTSPETNEIRPKHRLERVTGDRSFLWMPQVGTKFILLDLSTTGFVMATNDKKSQDSTYTAKWQPSVQDSNWTEQNSLDDVIAVLKDSGGMLRVNQIGVDENGVSALAVVSSLDDLAITTDSVENLMLKSRGCDTPFRVNFQRGGVTNEYRLYFENQGLVWADHDGILRTDGHLGDSFAIYRVL